MALNVTINNLNTIAIGLLLHCVYALTMLKLIFSSWGEGSFSPAPPPHSRPLLWVCPFLVVGVPPLDDRSDLFPSEQIRASHFSIRLPGRLRTSQPAVTVMVVPGHCLASLAVFLGLLLGLCGAQHAPDTLEVKMDGEVQIVSLNANVTIPCELSGHGSRALDVSIIGIRWFLRRMDSDKEEEIFEYNGGKRIPIRPGADISKSNLSQGDASLHLSHIQVQEGGEYRCEMIIPPRRAQGTARLDVVAQPSRILLPSETVVEEKKAYPLECIVTGFYPESVKIIWKKVIPGIHFQDVEISEGICMSSIRNNDGTFNATSYFILHPILEDNGTIYQCVVAHKSLLIPLQYSTTLIVTELVKATDWRKIIIYMPLVMVLCFFVWVLIEPFRKGPHISSVAPVLSPLPALEYLKHQELKTFYFVIWGYRPKPLTLKLFLKTDPLGEEELLFCQKNQGVEEEEKPESMQLMERQTGFTLSPMVPVQKDNLFGISCHLTILPDLARFTEADLLLQVEHSALKNPLRRKIHLKVIVQPKLKKIRCSSDHPQPGESVTLTCRIHSFFPRAIRVSWYKEGRLILEGIETSEVVDPPEDGLLCSCTSKLERSLQMEDLGKKFICEAQVEGGEPVERHWVL
ncbi:natural cytotoxicity triggering receptor 3 ligand 1 [Dromiciops gliroides]|uniref:natural cytotoxicity triggering receptor 3 ligand 1 n=1 Tax=Dromiciops gliroides TaxID=33562 RepID=UPI001CC64E28|nr:natural cytotoxicity triggering receptor 3 ligand 1 [Dromiciops gliroides]